MEEEARGEEALEEGTVILEEDALDDDVVDEEVVVPLPEILECFGVRLRDRSSRELPDPDTKLMVWYSARGRGGASTGTGGIVDCLGSLAALARLNSTGKTF